MISKRWGYIYIMDDLKKSSQQSAVSSQ